MPASRPSPTPASTPARATSAATATSTDPVLTPRALNRATLARQLLLRRAERPALDVVEHLVGLQAQAPLSPYYGLWSRVADFEPDDLAQLLLDRRAVRIVLMRGTVHLVSAGDALGLRTLFQPILDRELRQNPTRVTALEGVDLAELTALARPLLDEQPLSHAELGEHLLARWPGRRPADLGYGARNTLAVVQVPPRAIWGQSGQARLATVESWLGRSPDPSPAPEQMIRRYLAAFGPASVADMQTWSGLTRLREVVDRIEPELVTFRDQSGKRLFDLPDAPRPDPETPAPVRFLPEYDNLLRSHTDRSRVLTDADRKRIATKNGVAPHTVLIDGVFAGTWKLVTDKGHATLTVATTRPLSPADEYAVVEEGRRLLDFAAADADRHDIQTSTLAS